VSAAIVTATTGRFRARQSRGISLHCCEKSTWRRARLQGRTHKPAVRFMIADYEGLRGPRLISPGISIRNVPGFKARALLHLGREEQPRWTRSLCLGLYPRLGSLVLQEPASSGCDDPLVSTRPRIGKTESWARLRDGIAAPVPRRRPGSIISGESLPQHCTTRNSKAECHRTTARQVPMLRFWPFRPSPCPEEVVVKAWQSEKVSGA